MKALTLWQPWASLVALGVKPIETRGWTTTYRGPLAIHAAKKPIREKQEVGDWEAWPPDPPGRIHPNHDRERPARLYCNRAGLTTRVNVGSWWPLPLGAVVATCTLVDVVPMRYRWKTDPPTPHDQRLLAVDAFQLILLTPGETPVWRDVSDQRPYGDFSPGRYAWLLADIEPLAEPVPAKGRQGLWEWTPSTPALAR